VRGVKNVTKYLLTGFFALCIWGLFLADMLVPTRAFSELENRPLAQVPAFSARALFQNAYTLKYEEYVNDQFVGRDSWITLKSLGESALGKLENNGVIYGKQNQLFEEASTLDDRQLNKNVGYIQEFIQQYSNRNIALTIIPNSYAILEELLPEGLPVIDQKGIIQEQYARFAGEPVVICDITPTMLGHKDEYIYYRTDHHWTTQGAYLAYREYMEILGRKPVSLDQLSAHEVGDFYGTYYSKAKKWDAVPDVITWYDVETNGVTIDGKAVEGLYDHSMWEQRDKYKAFLHGNNGLMVIESGEEGAQGRILVFKDSYGNSLVPFLVKNFKEVHVVDLRYFNDVASLLEENSYDAIWVLYNFSSLATDQNLYKLVH